MKPAPGDDESNFRKVGLISFGFNTMGTKKSITYQFWYSFITKIFCIFVAPSLHQFFAVERIFTFLCYLGQIYIEFGAIIKNSNIDAETAPYNFAIWDEFIDPYQHKKAPY